MPLVQMVPEMPPALPNRASTVSIFPSAGPLHLSLTLLCCRPVTLFVCKQSMHEMGDQMATKGVHSTGECPGGQRQGTGPERVENGGRPGDRRGARRNEEEECTTGASWGTQGMHCKTRGFGRTVQTAGMAGSLSWPMDAQLPRVRGGLGLLVDGILQLSV